LFFDVSLKLVNDEKEKEKTIKITHIHTHAKKKLYTKKKTTVWSIFFRFFLLQSAGTFGRLATRKTFITPHTHTQAQFTRLSRKKKKEK